MSEFYEFISAVDDPKKFIGGALKTTWNILTGAVAAEQTDDFIYELTKSNRAGWT